MSQHNETVRASFTAQAQAFAASPWIADPERAAKLVAAAQSTADDRVLDVATGPGFVAEAFARVCHEVVGIDLTDALLAIAEVRRRERSIQNLSYRSGDVHQLPFPDGDFSIVVCRLSVHHFENPERVLREMVRVCRPGGCVLVEDIIASEHPDRAAYQNRIERLRDASHVEAYPLSRLLSFFAAAGLEVASVATDAIVPELEQWLATTNTPPNGAAEIRTLLEKDRQQDLSGMQPFFNAQHQLCFRLSTATLRGRKLPASRRP